MSVHRPPTITLFNPFSDSKPINEKLANGRRSLPPAKDSFKSRLRGKATGFVGKLIDLGKSKGRRVSDPSTPSTPIPQIYVITEAERVYPADLRPLYCRLGQRTHVEPVESTMDMLTVPGMMRLSDRRAADVSRAASVFGLIETVDTPLPAISQMLAEIDNEINSLSSVKSIVTHSDSESSGSTSAPSDRTFESSGSTESQTTADDDSDDDDKSVEIDMALDEDPIGRMMLKMWLETKDFEAAYQIAQVLCELGVLNF
ncbi:hypothetical protein EWM64_g539 [Hericium alpestre]|uniref:Uncharacterized protein n=1 Tax=Hericium alpestre TaxID=135208 RepID=A0A4Z0ABR5_9AGAM|nr:hypothetical protein EWM64_g539 [Hericium alpestre]